MKRRLLLAATVAVPCLQALPAAAADAPPAGYYGIGISVKTDGGMPWNPKLQSVTISRVAPASPAAQKGVAVGDQVIAADGLTIAGRKARELEPVMHKTVGQSLRLALKRPDGKAYEVTLVAVAKPAPAPAPATPAR
ncbi:PDZ domain-containing protein [Rhizobacter sp. P5_C2]